jgi:hypothetical protein
MANLTIALDDELLRRARIKAVSEGTSVNEVCRRAIEQYARADTPASADELIAEFRRIAAQARPREPGDGPLWPGREALYEEVMRERGLDKFGTPSAHRDDDA